MAETTVQRFEMDPKLYRAAMEGKEGIISQKTADYLSGNVTPQRNTALHIASRFGHSSFASEVLSKCPSLLKKQNADGDTPLHVAARGGYLDLVKTLIKAARETLPEEPEECHFSAEDLLQLRNLEGNTPLHEAVKRRHSDVSVLLLDEGKQTATTVNGDGESLLFVAATVGLESVVKKILLDYPDASDQGRMGMNALHGAAVSECGNADISGKG